MAVAVLLFFPGILTSFGKTLPDSVEVLPFPIVAHLGGSGGGATH